MKPPTTMTLKELRDSLMNKIDDTEDNLINFIDTRFKCTIYVQDKIEMWIETIIFSCIILGITTVIYFGLKFI